MSAKVLVVVYSTYGHSIAMARAAVAGVEKAGATATLMRVAETLSQEILEKMHAVEAQEAFASIPIATAADLALYDGIIFVSSTRFGGIPAQMRTLMDATGQLWATGALVGKVGSAMTSAAMQHGGQELAIQAMHVFMFHHGMIIVGLPGFQGIHGLEELKGGSYYGAFTIAGAQGQRMPSTVELEGATAQGAYVAQIAAKLKK